jgi:tetratricopeptide (TPR) repeat protein
VSLGKKCFIVSVCWLSALAGYGDTVPDWFIPLRDAIYEQKLSADEILPLYRETGQRAEETLSGAALSLMRSRCEYMMGRAYLYEKRKDEALACFEEGMAQARTSLDAAASAAAWVMLAENLSQSCILRPVSYVMVHGLDVERYAKNALNLDSGNTAALYLTASRWVYAPAPFHNHRRGIQMMEDILNTYDERLDKDDRFNVNIAIAYAYLEQKKLREAELWLNRARSVYPSNKYLQELLDKTKR